MGRLCSKDRAGLKTHAARSLERHSSWRTVRSAVRLVHSAHPVQASHRGPCLASRRWVSHRRGQPQPRPVHPSASDGALSPQAQQNIEHIIRIEAASRSRAGRDQLLTEWIAGQLGRPITLFVVLGATATWILLNLFARSLGFEPWDTVPFPILQGCLGLYAPVVATAVLVTQRRERAASEHRARVDLHVNLLAEQKAAKIIALLEELRRDLPIVHDREDHEAAALAEQVDAAAVQAALAPHHAPPAPTRQSSRPGDRPYRP